MFPDLVQVHPLVINPKSVTLNELYGAYDLATFEWADGILSTLFKQSAESDKPDEKVQHFGVCVSHAVVPCTSNVVFIGVLVYGWSQGLQPDEVAPRNGLAITGTYTVFGRLTAGTTRAERWPSAPSIL